MAYHTVIFHGTHASIHENNLLILRSKGNKAIIYKTGRTCWPICKKSFFNQEL